MKVIVPAAGLGTRLLPITNAIAKEMLPILDKPAIQYVLEEAVAAQLHHFVIIAGSSKSTLVRYLDTMPPLHAAKTAKQQERVKELIALQGERFIFVPQPEPLGLGHAILCAKTVIAEPFFAVMLPDDLYLSPQPPIGLLQQLALEQNASVIAVQRVPFEQLKNYGVIQPKKQLALGIYEVDRLIEKPENPPSSLAIVGRYVLSADIFPMIETLPTMPGKEIQLTDAIDRLCRAGHRVLAVEVPGKRFDVGTPQGLFEAGMAFAQHDERFSGLFANAAREFSSLQDS